VSAIATTGLYFTGHLTGDLYTLASRSQSGFVQVVGKAVYYALPNLERVNFRPQATYAVPVDAGTFLSGVGYSVAWAAVLIALATVIFERRDFR
jgi:Cu-processing system permease protein